MLCYAILYYTMLYYTAATCHRLYGDASVLVALIIAVVIDCFQTKLVLLFVDIMFYWCFPKATA